MTPDGLVLYATLTPPGEPHDPNGPHDVWKLERPSRDDPFGPPVLEPQLSSPKTEFDISISADAQTMYLATQLGNNSGSILKSVRMSQDNPFSADFDCDEDVDGVDFAKFAQCFNKAGNPPRTLGCPNWTADQFDFDGDNDIDGVDFAKFAACFNKAGNPPRTQGCPRN